MGVWHYSVAKLTRTINHQFLSGIQYFLSICPNLQKLWKQLHLVETFINSFLHPSFCIFLYGVSFRMVKICFHNEGPCIVIEAASQLLFSKYAYQENKASCTIRLGYAVLLRKDPQILDLTITKTSICSTTRLFADSHSYTPHSLHSRTQGLFRAWQFLKQKERRDYEPTAC